MEIWKQIKDYPGYEVSDQGRIKSFKQNKNGKVLNGIIRKGYLQVDFRKDGITHSEGVHRIVLSTFSPVENMEAYTVNHKDGNPLNNRLENLEWMTLSENTAHARRILQSGNGAIRVHIIFNDNREMWFETITEASVFLGVAKTTVARWVKGTRGYGNKYKLVEGV